ncbi:MAG: acyl-CoA dehydrogenase family protein [Candidatus Hydrogenedentota bacterium]
MNFELTREQSLLRDEIVRFSRQELNPGAAERDRDQTFPKDLWRKCGEMRLQGLPVPEEQGGLGLDPLSTALALEAFGYGCRDGGLVFSVCAHLLACVVPVWKYGSDDLKRKYLAKMCDGSLIAVNGMTEPSSGSDAFTMKTRAEPDGDGYRITGTKIMSSNAPAADVAIVYAMNTGAKGAIMGFLVEMNTPGVSCNQTFEKMGLRSSLLGEVVLENAYVPASAVIGQPGGGAVMFNQSMEWERICIGAAHIGTLQHLLETAIKYARTRRSAGKAIGKYQAVAHKIADMKIGLETARLLTYKAASRLGNARDIGLDASMVKVYVSETLVKVALDTVQVFGGYGFLTEYEVERILRDSVGSTLYSGANEVQRNIIGSWLGL